MTQRTMPRALRDLGPLLTVTTAAMVFAVLLVLVLARWRPLDSADQAVAAYLTGLLAGQAGAIAVVKAVTTLGSSAVLAGVVAAAAVFLAIRRRWRLLAYLAVTAAGAFVLDLVAKAAVGRLRPVVAHPVAHALGKSFPSGHALHSIVCYGAVLLVFLPAARGRLRPAIICLVAAVVALIGLSRITLGVHFASDVLAGWAIGITWLAVTATAFELTRLASGQQITDPVMEGLAPEESAELSPGAAGPRRPVRVRTAAALLAAWVLTLGLVVGFGEIVTTHGNGNLLGDTTVPHWLSAHRTPTLTRVSLFFTDLGSTWPILIVALAACLVSIAATRDWRPVRYVALVMAGELAAFVLAAEVIKRPRPSVARLDSQAPPTSSYPSGHTAATICLYAAIAIVVIVYAHGWWRWLSLVPAITFPVLVAASRLYRGEHHPTDIAGGLLLAALWLTAATLSHLRGLAERRSAWRADRDSSKSATVLSR
ncbi:MAG TPA: phosphatase PAP2 family protein [Streptosporangiaceae bacterium]|nr:phosphatase PAP2 family protein [Streptosporangiaceae bacterium]